MGKIILVTGGQRSGKSTYAEKMALDLSGDNKCVYMATAKVWDDEFAKRVALHKQRRGEQWINIEEEKFLSKHNVAGKVVLVDCVTLWSTNFFFGISTSQENESSGEKGNVVKRSLEAVKDEFDKFTQQDATFVFVTNEIGLSGVSENKIQRQFTDLLGWLNQYIASKADEVYFMVCGIPIKIK
ncbi:MAG: bifunctional adenosylcobinamide kinase/adenosylcobinamide-phosphate guanylyltransferase [Bacteroidales bacterium]|nr:bifunctional adenosylcobinamide kinase/adenosylcobinamide-phosphate guanylyltransferase [Bacteroidales bacterium]